MSEAIRRRAARARNRRAFTVGALLVVALAACAALLSTGAEARSAAVPSSSEPPTITGTAVSGETLTATTGSWTGTPPISYAFAWQRCDPGGGSCAPIGETSETHVVSAGDVGSTLRVLVTGRSPDGTIFIPFHFVEAAANILTNHKIDPRAKIPDFKVCAVKIEKTKAPKGREIKESLLERGAIKDMAAQVH